MLVVFDLRNQEPETRGRIVENVQQRARDCYWQRSQYAHRLSDVEGLVYSTLNREFTYILRDMIDYLGIADRVVDIN